MVKLRTTTVNGRTLPFDLPLGFVDGNPDRDIATEIFDKAGSPCCWHHASPVSSWMYPTSNAIDQDPSKMRFAEDRGWAIRDQDSGLDPTLCLDVFDIIISWIGPKSLALVACASRALWSVCSKDDVWRPLLQAFWDSGNREGDLLPLSNVSAAMSRASCVFIWGVRM